MPSSPSDPTQDAGFPARDGLLPPALRRDLTDLNAQYLDLGRVADAPGDPRFAWADPVRRRLAELDGPTRFRMAAAPFALFRLVAPPPQPEPGAGGGVADLPWAVPGAGWQGRCASFAHQAAFFARRLVDGVPMAATVVLDLAPEAQSLLAGMCPSQLAACAAHPGFVRPRWPRHLRFWEMLEAAARRDSPVAMQWAHCVGVCLLGADDTAAAAARDAVGRRRPRR